jgi:hypothetical protein
MRRFFIILLLVITGVTVALSFYQPPMRLMPTPTVFLNGVPNAFAANPALAKSNQIELFYATNRLPVGLRNNRVYAVVPGRDLNLGVTSIRIGDDATTWERIYEMSTNTVPDRRPRLTLQPMVEMGSVSDDERLSPGVRAWLALVNNAIDRAADKDIIIYVHGANSTVERAAGQAAQLRHFTGQNSVVLLFAWPTAENFLVYPRDMVTAFGAAPQLAKLVDLLARPVVGSERPRLRARGGAEEKHYRPGAIAVGVDRADFVGRRRRPARCFCGPPCRRSTGRRTRPTSPSSRRTSSTSSARTSLTSRTRPTSSASVSKRSA